MPVSYGKMKRVLNDLDRYLWDEFKRLKTMKEKDMLEKRYEKFRQMGRMS